MFILILLIISILVNATLIYLLWNLLRRYEKLEDFIVDIQIVADATLRGMRNMDIRGAFESDDEVGTAFDAIKGIVEDFAHFLGVEEEAIDTNES